MLISSVLWLGVSCQICFKDKDLQVCKFYKKCPVKEEKVSKSSFWEKVLDK